MGRRDRIAASVTVLAIVLGAATDAAAQADRQAWTTVLGRDTLAHATVGVVGKIERLADVSGTRVAVLAIAVEKVIWGELPGGETLIKAVRPERGTPEEVSTKAAVFLQPMRASWRVIGMFRADGDEGAGTLALLERHLAIERMADPAARAQAHRDMVLAGLVASDAWEFSVTLGELYKTITDARGLLEPRFRQALQRLAFEITDPDRANRLRELLRILPPPTAGANTGPSAPRPLVDHAGEPLVSFEAIRRLADSPADARRVELIHALARWPAREVAATLDHWLRHGDTEERAAAAFALGSLADTTEGALAAIRAGIQDPEPQVVRVAIRALGIHGTASDAPLLAQCADREALADEAIIALGRLAGGAEARQRLDEIARADPNPGRRRLAAYLLAARPAR